MIEILKTIFMPFTYIHAISMLNSLRLYTHLKNIPFPSFMIWAFGENWEDIPIIQLHLVWNQRHRTISKIKSIKDLSSIIFSMVDWYIQINKPI